MILTRAAPALVERVLEVRVAPADLFDPGERGGGERRPAEVRVDDDTGRVQRPPQAERPRCGQLAGGERGDVLRVASGQDLGARQIERGARRADRELVRCVREPLVAEQLVDRGEVAQAHRQLVACSGSRGDRR